MTSSKILFYFCLCFIAGVFGGSIIFISQLILLGFFIFGTFLASVLWQNKKAVFAGFCILFFSFGFWRAENVLFNARNNDFVKYGLFGKNVVLSGAVVREPDAREKSLKLTIGKIKLKAVDKEIPVSGKILLNAARYPEYKYGNLLKISGTLEEPPVFDTFDYKDYLLKDGIFANISFPKIELLKEKALEEQFFQRFYSGILRFKGKLRQSIFNNFSPPQSLVLEGMILGDSGAMTTDLKNQLNITGLRHVIAVSGTHVVILSSILMSLLLMFGLWRGQAIYFSLFFVACYVVLTGFAASGVRAGILGAVLLLAQKTGRMNTTSRAIIIAGALMLLQNPLLLLKDVGFQLSFLSSMGLIYFNPLVTSLLKFVPEKIKELKSIAATTISAQVFTLPILVFNFGNISLVSLATNMLVLPVVYWLMVFGFLAGIFGMISGVLGWIFALPCWILLSYFLKVMDVFSQPWMLVKLQNVHWIFLIISYLALGIIVNYFNKKNRLRFLNY